MEKAVLIMLSFGYYNQKYLGSLPKVIPLSGAYCINNSFINSIAMFFRMTYFFIKKSLSICSTFVCINKSEIFLASFPVFVSLDITKQKWMLAISQLHFFSSKVVLSIRPFQHCLSGQSKLFSWLHFFYFLFVCSFESIFAKKWIRQNPPFDSFEIQNRIIQLVNVRFNLIPPYQVFLNQVEKFPCLCWWVWSHAWN
jgi:hypothetical protein